MSTPDPPPGSKGSTFTSKLPTQQNQQQKEIFDEEKKSQFISDEEKEDYDPNYDIKNLEKAPKIPKSHAEIEKKLLSDLTHNPFKQYRSPQRVTRNTPYSNPIDQFKNSPHITGELGQESSHDSRTSFISTIVSSDDIDSIPPSSLFLGRIGQQKPKKLQNFIKNTPTQKEFFENAGFTDNMIKHTIIPSAILSGCLGLLTTPFERARALVQADAASISALQDAQARNMAGKIDPVASTVTSMLEANVKTQVPDTIDALILSNNKKNNGESKDGTKNIADKKSDGGEGEKKKKSPFSLFKKNNNSSSSSLGENVRLSSKIQPERRDTFSIFFKNNPNSTKAPILRPNPYDIHARRQILIFEEEFQKISISQEYKILTPMNRALKVKELNPVLLKNIKISPYDIFNHHIENGMSQRSSNEVISSSFVSDEIGNNHSNSAGNSSSSSSLRGKIKPMEPDHLPQNQTDIYRGFHRYYSEERYTTIRKALKSIYTYSGIKGCFSYSLMPVITRILPFIFLVTFYRPWKIWMTQTDGKHTIFSSEFCLSEIHARSQILTLLAMYPLLALLTAVHVNKTALYPNIPLIKSPELQHWKERFMSYHLLNNTFAKYTAKTPSTMVDSPSIFSKFFEKFKTPPQISTNTDASLESYLSSIPKYHDNSDNTPINKEYKNRQIKFINTMLKKELNKSRTKLIVEQLISIEGPKGLIRGIRPATLASMCYYTIYIMVFGIVGATTVDLFHQLRSKMQPSPPQGHQHDINLEIIKAIIPFTTATLAAQYLSYPLSTIRAYMSAAGSPGYIAFNNNANSLPYGIAVDQYRLPFRQVQKVKPREQMKIAIYEIRRQYGWKGLWHGSSIIPFVRVPQSLIIGSSLFYCLHQQWPAMNQLIDSQHFYSNLPPLL